jgi:hypothetical protein
VTIERSWIRNRYYTQYTSFNPLDSQVSYHGIIALKLRLALGLLDGTLGLALKLSSFSLCLASQLIRLSGSLTSEVVGVTLDFSSAETSSLLDLLCHLADLLDALYGGAGDALAVELSGGLRVERVSYMIRLRGNGMESASVFCGAGDDLWKRLTWEKKRVLRVVREAVAATRNMMAIVSVVVGV